MELEIAIYCDFFPNFNMHIIWEEIRGGRPLWTTPNISILHGWRPGRRRDAEGWEARLFADVMVATASRSPGSPRGRGRFTNRGSPQPRDPLKNESGRVLYVFVTHVQPPAIGAHRAPGTTATRLSTQPSRSSHPRERGWPRSFRFVESIRVH